MPFRIFLLLALACAACVSASHQSCPPPDVENLQRIATRWDTVTADDVRGSWRHTSKPVVVDSANTQGKRFSTMRYGRGDAELCCDLFTFENGRDGDAHLVSVTVARQRQSMREAIQLADDCWKFLTGDSLASRVNPDGLMEIGRTFEVDSNLPGDSGLRSAHLSIEHVAGGYVIRLSILAD